jgi:2-polyprenyl-6-methoxyphenol hydroxylase-like FAD-dependent oxidoreductase
VTSAICPARGAPDAGRLGGGDAPAVSADNRRRGPETHGIRARGLLGDAAFVVRPHTAGATAKAAREAATLARALKRAGGNADAGLSGFEEMQIGFGQRLVDYGVALGRRWAA